MLLIKVLEQADFFKTKRLENYYQQKLHQELGGQREFVLPNRKRIDLLTETELIEVKHARRWFHGVGQLLAYSLYYPSRQKRLHLFGFKSVRNPRAVFDSAKHVCDSQEIKLTWEA